MSKENNNRKVEKTVALIDYEKPKFAVFELITEGLICTSGYDGSITDPGRGEDSYWPGFDREREF